ncbi:MAG: hypothetical protein IH936_02460 [Acidobacteria bacterium]|nr:hypothetical protein [Acidobacteriota bacterium]
MRKLTAALALACGAFLVTPAFAAEPIATVETNWDGISLEVMALDRKGSVLTLKWAVRNDGDETTRVAFSITGNGVRTYVVDEESGTKYYVLTDKEGHAVASSHTYISSDAWGIELEAVAGKSSHLWMKLPGPPPAVKVLTLFFDAAVEPLEDVPITDK